MFSTALWIALLITVSVTANPVIVNRTPVTLPLSRRLNLSSVHNLVRNDQARARALKTKGIAKSAGIHLQNDGVFNQPLDDSGPLLLIGIFLGHPVPFPFTLILDTGSSNTWVGADQPYVITSTSILTSNKVSVTYPSGSFSGTEFIDQLSLGTGLNIPKQSIGVATTVIGFEGVDGVLGIGPADLTLDTLSPASTSGIPTVTDNLFSTGAISSNSIGLFFEPTIDLSRDDVGGTITWGGTDSSKFTGSVTFTPITTVSPANNFWGINQSVRYGSSTTILTTTAGIVDTGTTVILLATNGFNRYKIVTGAVPDGATGLLSITLSQFTQLQSLFFTIGPTTFELTANAQIWPRVLNVDIGGTSSLVYLIVADLGSNSGEGLDFVNGVSFLRRFYTVLDTTNRRVGFATTPFTKATSN